MLFLKGLVGLHRTVQLQLFQHTWITVILNGLPRKRTEFIHSVIFEIASKYCISESSADHDGYSISSEGFPPTVVDILVMSSIHPFQSILVC